MSVKLDYQSPRASPTTTSPSDGSAFVRFTAVTSAVLSLMSTAFPIVVLVLQLARKIRPNHVTVPGLVLSFLQLFIFLPLCSLLSASTERSRPGLAESAARVILICLILNVVALGIAWTKWGW